MSLTEKEKRAEAESLNVEGILADFFLKKYKMKDSIPEDKMEIRKKSKKKHKSKKSKHKHRTRSHSSERAQIRIREGVECASSSEEKDIKRLKKIKNLEARDSNKSSIYIPTLIGSQSTSQSSENPCSIEATASIDIPYGPSLELLLTGTETNKIEINSKPILPLNDAICEVPNNEIKNEPDYKIEGNSISSIVELETKPILFTNGQETCSHEKQLNTVMSNVKINDCNIISKEDDRGVGRKASEILYDNEIKTGKSISEYVVEKKGKCSRSRSRSEPRSIADRRSHSRSRSKTRSKTKYSSHSRSRSSSRSRSKFKSTRRGRSRSRELSNSKSKTHSRSHYRKRSRSRSEESKRKYKKHLSRSRSKSAARYHRRTRSRSYSRDRYKSKYSNFRMRSKHNRRNSRSRSRERINSRAYKASRSRSKSREYGNSRSKKASRSRSRENSSSRAKKTSRSRSRSKEHTRYRSSRESSPETKSRSKKDSSPKSKSRSKRESPSKSREKESDSSKEKKIDQAKILQIAQKNVLSMIEKGTMPEGLSLEQFKKEQLVSIKAGGKSVQELTDFCTQLSKRENDPVDETDTPTDINNQDSDTGFIHHPFKLKEQPMIKLNIKNAVQIPIKTHAEKFAETAKLSSQFPVSSGNQHKKKELEWIPVEPDKNKSTQPVNEVKAVVPVVHVTSQAEVLNQETVTSDATIPTNVTSLNTTSYIPLPSAPLPVLMPPPLPPPLPPPPPLPQISSTGPIPNQPEHSLPSINTTSTPAVSYPMTICSNPPLSILPSNSGVIVSSSELPSTNSSVRSTSFQPTKHIDISSIVTKRFKALTKLQEDPNDVSALQTLQEAQTSIQEWVQSQQVPGLFTGSTDAKLLTVEELCGPRHWNYRVKRDIFARAAPVTEGKGMSLLKKMGWNPGEGLGKNKEGSLEPLVLDIKTDKKGLVSEGEGGKKGITSTVKELQGKHPVSALMELCSKRKWKPPLYTVVKDQGPPHRKIFLFKVEVNGVEHIPATPSSNKKVAKADAAVVCLQALNVFPK